MPKLEEIREVWFGIGFLVAGERLTLPVQEVQELLNLPKLYRVPGTKHWVKGLANVRGRIMTVIDLAAFLMGQKTAMKPRSRILAIQDEAMQAGLLVDEVQGLKHFYQDDYQADTGGFADWIAPFLHGSYGQGGQHWGVVNKDAILNSPDFLHAGL